MNDALSRLTPLEQEIQEILLAHDWKEWEQDEEAWELSVRCGIDPDTGLMLASTDSRTLPDLPNKPDKTNWVEKAGGLPSYIKRIARSSQASPLREGFRRQPGHRRRGEYRQALVHLRFGH